MLIGFLSVLFFIFNIFLIIIVVMQKNHGGFWSGPAGSDSTLLFGGNQGADVLQKLTWFFGILLMVGCFALSMYHASSSQVSKFQMVTIVPETSTGENKTTEDNQLSQEVKSEDTEKKNSDKE